MQIIEQLKFHEVDELEEWLSYSEKNHIKFSKELVAFSELHESEIRAYCQNLVPTEFSSLSIVYEALSSYSDKFNEFLSDEVKRIVLLAKEKKMPVSYLDILTDIETEALFANDKIVYLNIIDFLTSQLSSKFDKSFTIELLEVIEWYLLEIETTDSLLKTNPSIQKIRELANEGSFSEKIKARKILKELECEEPLEALSFSEKLKAAFK